MSPDTAPSRRRPRPLTVVLGLLVLMLIGAVVGAIVVGPRFGLWVIPPSPARYTEVALDTLQTGYHATTPAWEAARDAARETGRTASTYEQTHAALKEATKAAGGKHSFFLTPAEYEESRGESTAAFAPPTVTTTGRVTTVTVPAVGFATPEQQQQYADAAAKGIEAAAPNSCGWIVDLRGNTGGTMYPMIAGLVPLLPDGPGLVFRTNDGTDSTVSISDGGLGFGGPPTMATSVRTKVTGQDIAVLYDEQVASSGEAVATMFRGVDGVRSFGTPTAGYTSGNTVIQLYDGARLVLTQVMYVDRAGVNLNEEPLQPDEATGAADAEAAARAWLAQGSCR